MTEESPAGPPATTPLRPLLAAALVAVAFALAAGSAAGFAIGVVGGAVPVLVGVLWPRRWAARVRPLALAPALFGLSFGAVTSAPAPADSLLAAFGGLLLLAWWSAAHGEASGRGAGRALALPALAVAVALGASLFLPPTGAAFGVAAALLVGVLLYVGWLFEHPSRIGSADPQRS